MMILQVDIRETGNDWLHNLTISDRIAAITTQPQKDHDIPVLRIDRGDKLIMVDNDSWSEFRSSKIASAYAVEIRYHNDYRTYETRLYRPDKILVKPDKLPLFDGVYIITGLRSVPDINNQITGYDYKFSKTRTWWGCYQKGLRMKKEGFLIEAIEWFQLARNINPLRLEVLAELGELVSISDIKTALDVLDLPFHHPSKVILENKLKIAI